MIGEAWDRLRARGPSWFWLAHGMKNGDFYHACLLAAAFRDMHGRDLPIRVVVASRSLMDVAALFGDLFAEVLHMGEFSAPAETWRLFLQTSGLPAFGPETPILLHPLTNPETVDMTRLIAANGLTWMALYRHILRLDGDARIAAPAADVGLDAAVAKLCASSGIERDRAAILFPYAQSFPVSALAHFAKLAERMAEQGLMVFTSVANDEMPVKGTRPVKIPFSLLPGTVEHAGWAVAIRSGVCDIVAPTHARKSFIFRHGRELPLWGLASMGLCHDADEITFDFPTRSPEDFADTVLARDAAPPPILRRERISDALARPLASTRFADLGRDAPGILAWATATKRVLSSPPGAVRLLDVPPRGHPRWEPFIADVMASIVEHGDDDRDLYVCRDRGGFDGFEPVLADALLAGHYAAGDDFHTVIAVSGALLADRLPVSWRRRVIAPTPLTPGDHIVLAEAWGGPGVRDYGDGLKPLVIRGLRLLDGWYEPEPWGLWSRGCRATIGFCTPVMVAARYSLRLGIVVAASPRFPNLTLSARVNGAVVSRAMLRGGDTVLDIDIAPELAFDTRQFLVRLDFERVHSPIDHGTGPDGRLLGIGLHWAELVARDVEPCPGGDTVARFPNTRVEDDT